MNARQRRKAARATVRRALVCSCSCSCSGPFAFVLLDVAVPDFVAAAIGRQLAKEAL